MSLPLPLHAYIKTNGGTKHPNVISDSCLQRKKRKEKKPAASGAAPANTERSRLHPVTQMSIGAGTCAENKLANTRREGEIEGGEEGVGGGGKGNRKWAGAMDGGGGRRQLCGAGGGWGSEVKVTLSRVAGAAATGGGKKKNFLGFISLMQLVDSTLPRRLTHHDRPPSPPPSPPHTLTPLPPLPFPICSPLSPALIPATFSQPPNPFLCRTLSSR